MFMYDVSYLYEYVQQLSSLWKTITLYKWWLANILSTHFHARSRSHLYSALSRSRRNYRDLLLRTAYTLCASYADKPPANLITCVSTVLSRAWNRHAGNASCHRYYLLEATIDVCHLNIYGLCIEHATDYK